MGTLSDRSGEKFGWIGGWIGGFIWVVILAGILLFRGQLLPGAIGLALAAAAVVDILTVAPWKHPDTPYWKLMLPVYGLFLVSIAWAVWVAEDGYDYGLNPWHAFLLLPILSPFWTVGRRRWSDADRGDRPIERP